MFGYIVRRLIVGVVMLIVMSFVTYILFFASPVNPARFACGKVCGPAQIKQTAKFLGYDKPMVTQWAEFMEGVVKGRDFPDDKKQRERAPQTVVHCSAPCLGYSMLNTTTVNSELKTAFPVSFSLAIIAFIMWMAGAITFGVIAALRRGTVIDRGITAVALLFYAFPTFWIGLALLDFVSIKWGLWPAPTYESIADGGFGGWLLNTIMPGFTLCVVLMAGYLRMTRAFVLESFGEDYIRTARSKGVPERRVVFKHALRAALTPLVTMAGMDLAILIGGAIITETVFNYPGLGKLAVTTIQTNDLPTEVGLVVLLAALVIVANIVVDVLYAYIDPRVRLT
ncbi:MAG: ABC transporter permease [Marmoricola sp.]